MNKDKKLTPNQEKVLKAIKEFIAKKGFSPTFSELRQILSKKGVKLKSNNSILQYLNALEEKGFIQKFSKARGIRVLHESIDRFVSLPLLGQADCGQALSFANDIAEDYINISKAYLRGDKNDYFFVKSTGDSMNKAGINNGDLVLVKKIEGKPEDGQVVVAVINGLGTIKQFREINGTPILKPESTNPAHQPIILHPNDQVYIAGEVIKVFHLSTMEKEK